MIFNYLTCQEVDERSKIKWTVQWSKKACWSPDLALLSMYSHFIRHPLIIVFIFPVCSFTLRWLSVCSMFVYFFVPVHWARTISPFALPYYLCILHASVWHRPSTNMVIDTSFHHVCVCECVYSHVCTHATWMSTGVHGWNVYDCWYTLCSVSCGYNSLII